MSTTLLFAEFIIIGLQVLLWFFLIVLILFGHSWLKNLHLSQWQGLGTIFILASAYTIGTLFDRLTDRIFHKWNENLKTEEYPTPHLPLVAIRYMIAKDNDYLNRLFEYTRSRMRIARATAINSPIIAIFFTVWVLFSLSQLDRKMKVLIVLVTIGFTIVLTLLAAQAWRKLMRTYMKLVKSNYQSFLLNQAREVTNNSEKNRINEI